MSFFKPCFENTTRGAVRSLKQCAILGATVTLPLIARVGTAAAQSQISAPLRAAIIKKVISYDKTLPATTNATVFVYYSGATSNEANELTGALTRAGVATQAVASEDDLKRRSADVKVLYVLADDAPAGVRNYCKQTHCLSMTSSIAMVEQGDASVAIAALNGKPQLAVHMKRLSDEKHDLSAEMLQLARVIR